MNRWLWVSLLLTLAALGGSLYVYYGLYDRLPEQVPTHANLHGETNQWTPRDQILPHFLILPCFMAAFVVLTRLLPWLSPKPFDVESFRDTFNYLMALVVALFGYMHLTFLLGALQLGIDGTRLMIAGIFFFLALIGNSLGRVRRNFWMGVRTPWTLASEKVWIQTHRLTAWLLVPAGVLGGVAVLAGAPLVACFVGLMIVCAIPVLYSLILYKRLEKQGKLTDSSPPSGATGATA
jgi:uncharacterized membrane protein